MHEIKQIFLPRQGNKYINKYMERNAFQEMGPCFPCYGENLQQEFLDIN